MICLFDLVKQKLVESVESMRRKSDRGKTGMGTKRDMETRTWDAGTGTRGQGRGDVGTGTWGLDFKMYK